jgi:hypothetical protein
MILRAIQEGASDLGELQRIFEVHPRLLIEGLVTLTQAGWLALGGPGREGFVLTSEGREAAGSEQPPSTIAVAPRRAFVVMERLTGGLIANDEVRFVTRRDLDRVWEQTARLSPEVSDNRLDQGQVQHLLPRRQGEWVRWIGPIDMVSKDAHWLPVNVDPDGDVVVGLPDVWLPRLRASVIEDARRIAMSLSKEGRAHTWTIGGPRRGRATPGEATDPDALRVPPVGWPAALSESDFCFSRDDHEGLLVAALGEARSSILVASAFASTEKLEALRPHLEATLRRGISVDLLWGYMAGGSVDGRETVEWMRKLEYSAKRDRLKGLVRFNRVPSGSHAKLLLWDDASGFRGCVGSYNWLSAVGGRLGSLPLNASVRISEPAAGAALARCAAALWVGAESEVLTSTGDRWGRIAADLEMTASRSEPVSTNAMLRLVLDRDHEVVLREWLRTSQHRLLVTSHRLGPSCEVRLVSAEVERPGAFAFDVFYGLADRDDDGLSRIGGTVRRSRGRLKQVAGLHAKVLVSDASACVTSYNFLSADPFGTAKNARELGVAIDGGEPAGWLWNRLHRELSEVA